MACCAVQFAILWSCCTWSSFAVREQVGLHHQGGHEASCQSEDDHGWPRFQNQEELQETPWSSYFVDVFGELPSEYPVCIFDLWAINKAAYKKAGITGHEIVPAGPELKDGDLFEGGLTGYQIYHSNWKPLPANTWFQLTHSTIPTELKSAWVWRQRGSGIWYNTGNTMVFPTPADPMKTHKEAIAFLTANCSVKPAMGWPRQESDIFGTCAREKGIDTIQFEPMAGQVPVGTFGEAGLTEIVLVNLDGKYSCGVEDASKTPLREGWMASKPCDCQNDEIPDSCALMKKGPFPLNLLGTDPPLCKLQEKNHFKECDPTTCKKTSCGPKVIEPEEPKKFTCQEGQGKAFSAFQETDDNSFESCAAVCEALSECKAFDFTTKATSAHPEVFSSDPRLAKKDACRLYTSNTLRKVGYFHGRQFCVRA